MHGNVTASVVGYRIDGIGNLCLACSKDIEKLGENLHKADNYPLYAQQIEAPDEWLCEVCGHEIGQPYPETASKPEETIAHLYASYMDMEQAALRAKTPALADALGFVVDVVAASHSRSDALRYFKEVDQQRFQGARSVLVAAQRRLRECNWTW